MTKVELERLVAQQAEMLATMKATLDTLASQPKRAEGKSMSQRRSDLDTTDGVFVCTAHKGECGLAKNGRFVTKGGVAFHKANGGVFAD